MLAIDGSMGEGGGQVLRSALALSSVTGTPFTIERIRAGRDKSGLLRQHLTAVNAMAEVCSARVSGNELRSSTLRFEPGTVRHGEYTFAVGSAGSASLVLQTVLPALLVANGHSRLVLEGGTHNPNAPPFDFIAQTFLPTLRRLGVDVSARLDRYGFYPAGGGRFTVDVAGGLPFAPLALTERAPLERVRVRALVSALPEAIAWREVKAFARSLADYPLDIDTAVVESAGPGNVITATVTFGHHVETLTAFGAVGLRGENLARSLATRVREFVESGAPVGDCLADQLLVPMALGAGGTFRTSGLTLHARTNIEVIAKFLPNVISAHDEGGGSSTVTVSSSASG